MVRICSMFALMISILLLTSCKFREYKEKVDNTVIHEVDLSTIGDGDYQGFYDCYFVKAKVKVTMKDNIIADIQLLEHENGRGKDGEKVIPAVVREQRLSVDTITGATASSKVILKAIELALTGEGDESY